MFNKIISSLIGTVKKAFDFKSRASRFEYWTYQIASNIVFLLLSVLMVGFEAISEVLALVFLAPVLLVTLALLFINIAVSVRRLHDVGLSGFWLLYFLPLGLGLAAVYLAYLLDLDPSCNKIIENNKKVGSHWLGWILTVLLWSTGCSLILFIITLTPGQKEENAYGLNPCYDFD